MIFDKMEISLSTKIQVDKTVINVWRRKQASQGEGIQSDDNKNEVLSKNSKKYEQDRVGSY